MSEQSPTPIHSFKIRYQHLLVILLVLFAFFMSALVSRTVFERLPHLEDEVAYLFQAKILARGQLVIDSPEPHRAYWQPFIVDYGPTDKRFGKYSLGWPAFLAIGVVLGQEWVVNAFLAGLAVALVYRLGSEIFDPDVGLIAAGLSAFSPMALLLNGSLMGHTAALFCTLVFLYAYWRLERSRKRKVVWGIIAGLGLGLVIINRPATGVALAIPFVLWSGFRLFSTLTFKSEQGTLSFHLNLPELGKRLLPLAALAVLTLVVCAAIPIFNYAATGDARYDLYTLVWEYDQIGFGADKGPHTHFVEKGFRQTRWDLSLTAADLFGWETGSITTAPLNGELKPDIADHYLNNADYFPNVGLSWVLLPFGLILGLQRRWRFMLVWLIVGTLIILATPGFPNNFLLNPTINSIWQSLHLPKDLTLDYTFSYLWLGLGVVWCAVPLAVLAFRYREKDTQTVWTWLFVSVIVCVVGIYIAYWVGSQRYSTRYYFEAMPAFAILSALPLAWLARRWRAATYIGITALLIYSLYDYSIPRVSVLYRFNFVNGDVIQQAEARRTDNRPLLILVTGPDGDVKWRSMGSFMAETSPYLDSDIVVAWDFAPKDSSIREAILKRFPDRQVIEMTATGNDAAFVDPSGS